jgi:hypothetical protein
MRARARESEKKGGWEREEGDNFHYAGTKLAHACERDKTTKTRETQQLQLERQNHTTTRESESARARE